MFQLIFPAIIQDAGWITSIGQEGEVLVVLRGRLRN